jgi:Arm DNA-binding domain
MKRASTYHLTPELVAKALPPDSTDRRQNQRFWWDDGLAGFALRVTVAGAKSFVWQGVVAADKREIRMTLGKLHPGFGVFEARRLAVIAAGMAAQGATADAIRDAIAAEHLIAD